MSLALNITRLKKAIIQDLMFLDYEYGHKGRLFNNLLKILSQMPDGWKIIMISRGRSDFVRGSIYSVRFINNENVNCVTVVDKCLIKAMKKAIKKIKAYDVVSS